MGMMMMILLLADGCNMRGEAFHPFLAPPVFRGYYSQATIEGEEGGLGGCRVAPKVEPVNRGNDIRAALPTIET